VAESTIAWMAPPSSRKVLSVLAKWCAMSLRMSPPWLRLAISWKGPRSRRTWSKRPTQALAILRDEARHAGGREYRRDEHDAVEESTNEKHG